MAYLDPDEVVAQQLAGAHAENEARAAKLKALRAAAADRSLDIEARLRAMMGIDAVIWSRRVRQREGGVGGEPDKIDKSKAAHERRRVERKRAERAAAGRPMRRRRRKGGDEPPPVKFKRVRGHG